MIKGLIKQKKKITRRSFIALILIFLVAGVSYNLFRIESKSPEKIQASTVVTPGDFRLTADNSWDNSTDVRQNYAKLDWTAQDNLTQSGYKLYQSEDGGPWENRSMSYGKSIRVLNVYPEIPQSNTLKGWMDGLGLKADDGITNLIQVTPVDINDYNANPNSFLKAPSGEYLYDVIMFGSWDCNYFKILNATGYQATRDFVNTGRGVLFGHDTIVQHNSLKPAGVDHFLEFRSDLGIGYPPNVATGWDDNWDSSPAVYTGSDKIKILNNGYLMKYPFEMGNGVVLDIPYTHNTELSAKGVGTVWAELIEPKPPLAVDIYDDANWRGAWFLKTNNNVAMIQTGHSNGTSYIEERQIIANVLYNLAQVSLESNASDYSVKDDQAPDKPKSIIRCGSTDSINIRVDAKDKGKKYRFKVEADTRDGILLTSDIVEEVITSNIAGYFYAITDSPIDNPTTGVAAKVKGLKDSDPHGRINPDLCDLKTDPDDDSVEYETAKTITLSSQEASGKYLHVVAIDRASNISEVSSQLIEELVQPVDFEIERTGDEAKLVDLAIDTSIGNKMKSIEIQIPKNTEIKDFASLTLPTDWYSFENSETTDYYSFSFAMENNNAAATIQNFLNDLRFTINDPVNNAGTIKVILHEKVYTSWIDGDGKAHYYVFMPEFTAPGKNWFQAYNSAKKMKYRGLTGYLATIMSEEEHNFIFDNIAKEPGWLGGTRGVLVNQTKINDEMTVPQRVEDYNINQDEWYWANGPESGNVFFVGKTRTGSYTPPNAYSAFTPTEPSNHNSEEYALQFAQLNNKYWNDLPGNWTYDPRNLKGYYVEFSEYGGQTESEELTDVCWNAAIPQKISLKAYEEDGTALPAGDILYDQELRIGKAITVVPKELDFYTFLELRDMSNTPKPLSYKVTDTHQEGKLIYSLRRANLNVRQVITNSNTELVVPSEGYLSVKHQLNSDGSINGNYQLDTRIASDKQSNNPGFTKVIFATDHLGNAEDKVQLSVIVPAFYKIAGYSLSNDQASHTDTPDFSDDKILLSRTDIYDKGEYWITIYLEPNGTNGGHPQPYSWDYKHNDLGKIVNP
ncbi:hypothetical protein JZO70_20440 [Enterococcus sp. 669A]|uniref:DUF5057 domain-containing protein n=1 Tax=Candidatus Enterococcus moelleringii TaxID=2815325 RepID=A0ABS3LFZ5_9ENTE|nr:hypothetical protein [Enterococcus sp. 669A]MBO1308555.1 hypothetical protein [Enterococcus sp. 669A]